MAVVNIYRFFENGANAIIFFSCQSVFVWSIDVSLLVAAEYHATTIAITITIIAEVNHAEISHVRILFVDREHIHLARHVLILAKSHLFCADYFR